MAKALGIDFGTSTTLVSYRDGDNPPVILPIGRGGQTPWMPSVAGIAGDTFVAGEDAADLSEPIRSIKSHLTLNRDTGGTDGLPTIELIREILAVALHRAQQIRPEIAGVGNIYMGCPAEWDGSQRRALADIARQLGLDVDLGEIIDEPVAAGLAWIEEQWQAGIDVRGRVVIFDAGGGTLDVAVLEADVSPIGERRMVVLAAHSLAESGDVIDSLIARFLVKREKGESLSSTDVLEDPALLKLARNLKEQLSVVEKAVVANDSIYIDTCDDIALTREELANVVEGQVLTSIRLVEKTLRTSKYRGSTALRPSDVRAISEQDLFGEVDHVVLVGGMSRLSSFREALKGKFSKSKLYELDNPQELVALGLTYGDKLQSLNLPRPPVNFVITGGDAKSVLYQAFTPLYSWQDEIRNDGLYKEFRFGGVPLRDAQLICESPTRDNRRLELVLAIKHDQNSNPRARMWWDPDQKWQKVDREELPNFPEFVAELDWRVDHNQIDELDGFVDYLEYLKKIEAQDAYEVSYFVGNFMTLPGATDEGKIVLYADGRLLIRTSGVVMGARDVVLRILYWPLKPSRSEGKPIERSYHPTEPASESSTSPSLPQPPPSSPSPAVASKPVVEMKSALPDGDSVSVSGNAPATSDEAYEAELGEIRQKFYDWSPVGELMAEAHRAVAVLMSDYGLDDAEISEELNISPNGNGIDFLMVTEDDTPKVVMIRTLPEWVSVRDQVMQLEALIDATKVLSRRSTKRGLTGRDREWYSVVRAAAKKDAEFHCWLVLASESGEIVNTSDLFGNKLSAYIDSTEVFLKPQLVARFCSESVDPSTDVEFVVNNSDFYQHQSLNGDRVVSMLISAEEYVKGTYPLGVDLFRLNPRLFLSKKAGPNRAMLETLSSEESGRFHLLNNGITGVCEEISVILEADRSRISIRNLQIVNGCQTTETIWTWARRTNEASRVLVPLRIVRGGADETLARRISSTTNSQSAIAAADLVAGDGIQKRLKDALFDEHVFYEARRGELRRIAASERTHFAAHPYSFLNRKIVSLDLREMGQALLSVSGRPNQAKEQIASLFKDANRVSYREMFEESWTDGAQIALLAVLFVHIRDVANWNTDAKLRQLAGLGRFYVMFLVYDYLRAVANDSLEEGNQIDGESLMDPFTSRELLENFDVTEINRLANEAVRALKWVMDNGTDIDGYRALLRQGTHKQAISNRFDKVLGII